MSEWKSADGGTWFGPDARGDFHPQGADTDMADMSRDEIEQSFGPLTPVTVVENQFGQQLRVGDVVGWGHRDGNLSRQQVGIILELQPYEGTEWLITDGKGGYAPTLRHRAKCYWVADKEYKSSCEAHDLFLLDRVTLGEQVRRRIMLALNSQLP